MKRVIVILINSKNIMRGKAEEKDIWPIGRPDETFNYDFPVTNHTILKIFLYRHITQKLEIYASAKSVAVMLDGYAKAKNLEISSEKNLIIKIKSLHAKFMALRAKLGRKTATEEAKRRDFIDNTLFKVFDLGVPKPKAETSKSSSPSPISEILGNKRTRTSKIVCFNFYINYSVLHEQIFKIVDFSELKRKSSRIDQGFRVHFKNDVKDQHRTYKSLKTSKFKSSFITLIMASYFNGF